MSARDQEDKNMMFRTLLVEDSESIRQVVKFYLQSEFPSMSVIEAEDGVEALKQIDTSAQSDLYGLYLTRRKRP